MTKLRASKSYFERDKAWLLSHPKEEDSENGTSGRSARKKSQEKKDHCEHNNSPLNHISVEMVHFKMNDTIIEQPEGTTPDTSLLLKKT
jgi:hypothetical protein